MAKARLFSLLLVLLLLPAQAYAGCGQHPLINITTSEHKIAFDTAHAIADLNAMELDTRSPFPDHFHTDVGGVMSGQVIVDHKISFGGSRRDGLECAHVKKVDVTISIKPTIYIASDLQQDDCRFREIFRHESRHVDVDRALMEKYKTRLSDALELMLSLPADYDSGWLVPAQAAIARDEMQENIHQALGVMFTQMMEERRELQQQVDSRDEYMGIARACQSDSSS